jgi:hypothetical protein
MKSFYDNFESRRKREQKQTTGFFAHIADFKSSQFPSQQPDNQQKTRKQLNPQLVRRFVFNFRNSVASSKSLSVMASELHGKLSDLTTALRVYPILASKNFLSSSLLFEFFNKFQVIFDLVDSKFLRNKIEKFSSNFFSDLLEKIASAFSMMVELFSVNFSGPFDSKQSLFTMLQTSNNSRDLMTLIIEFLTNSFNLFKHYRKYQEVRYSNVYNAFLNAMLKFEMLLINSLLEFPINNQFSKIYMNMFLMPIVSSVEIPFIGLSLEQERKALASISGVRVTLHIYDKLLKNSALSTKDVELITKHLFQIIFFTDSFANLLNSKFEGFNIDHNQLLLSLEHSMDGAFLSASKTTFYVNCVFYLRYLYSIDPMILEKFKKIDSIDKKIHKFMSDSNEVIMVGKVLREFGHSEYNSFFENAFDDKFLLDVTNFTSFLKKSQALLNRIFICFLYSFELNRYNVMVTTGLRLSKNKDLIGHLEAQLIKTMTAPDKFIEAGVLLFTLADLLTFHLMTDDNLTVLSKFPGQGKNLKVLYEKLLKPVTYYESFFYNNETVEKSTFKKIAVIMSFLIDCNWQTHIIDYDYIFSEKKQLKLKLEFIKDFYFLADLEGRFKVFKDELKRFDDFGYHIIEAVIRRNYLVEDGVAFIKDLLENGNDPRIKIKVVFIDDFGNREEGADAGGLFKDFISEMIKVLYNPEYGLLIALQGNHDLFLNPNSRITFGDADEDYFIILGYILAKSLQMGITLNVSFSRVFLRKLKGLPNYFKELKQFDSELFSQLNKLKSYEDVESLGLTFSTVEDFSKKEVELIPGGASIPVTNDNVIKYTYFMANYKMNLQVKRQYASFVKGFERVFGVSFLKLFSEEELQQLISGTEEPISIADLRENTIITGPLAARISYLNDFWDVLESFSDNQRKLLLKFVTNIDRSPIFGFKNLEPKFQIMLINANNIEDLPRSATCQNILFLPVYPSKEILKSKLTKAVEFAKGHYTI